MKTLIALSVVQTVGIASILVVMLGQPSAEIRDATTEQRVATAEQGGRMVRAHGSAGASAAPVDARPDIRALIREELAAANLAATPTRPESLPATPKDVVSEPRQREAVAQQIEIYRSVGSIDDAQLQELQTQIMSLDPTSRKQLMAVLARALNSQEIKSRF